jgi:hypothetical protein
MSSKSSASKPPGGGNLSYPFQSPSGPGHRLHRKGPLLQSNQGSYRGASRPLSSTKIQHNLQRSKIRHLLLPCNNLSNLTVHVPSRRRFPRWTVKNYPRAAVTDIQANRGAAS